MEARIILQIQIHWNPNRKSSRTPLDFPRFIRASSSSSTSQKPRSYRGPKPSKNLVADFISKNDDLVRSLPIYVGGASLLAVLFNRTVSGIAPVADASSSQSRADLLALGLAVTNLLTGLVWLSIRPKSITPVNPEGVECKVVESNLPASIVSELLWAWESFEVATCCKSLVIVYNGICLIQIGMVAESPEDKKAVIVNTDKLMQGSVYRGVMKSKAQSYLANLSLYPGRSELPFLPANTQAVILQPLGDKGIAVIGGNTIRGFTSSDQAWISSIGEKLDATLGRYFIDSDEISRVTG
ncbi:Cofactor assembly of complex C subunit B CCB2/CCB4 [Arabidopsis thaliana x Arabidopsis arenosa]|uniref:Cofactor assembly of complex C subunit B CCB2/CCB4 n=1 Tax=Arabidopsis thaliana x Arabidopsis arenosa TaxID=1240361 RepID=A0A8T2BH11_9BRAS|nr:Cofactor assembly of complex C subunit B CCB2/CCB4 [Arabidopsis thaliana x Arabidopsis arenosa]KAG7585214.1 Cofactor assembly of complex C subunit B CCB2/CCB4 [Arabidopsis thaliana x Arabidopsis arenosa]KAG7585215.1 Cofactor assembly of complex C subunit B CCB2/CCB4 [Arabidopsis thaliana x Arabidopsis arenosa]